MCGEKGTSTFEHGEVLGHNYSAWESNGDGTHTKTCSNDNNHKITENCNGGTATCTELATCKDCGEKYGDLKQHEFNQVTTEDKYLAQAKTCETKAKYYYSCVCGEKGTSTFEHGEAFGHNWNEGDITKESTCNETGTAIFTCDRCNEIKVKEIEKKAHDTGTKIIESTCDAPGYTLTYCKNCSYSDWSNFKKSKEHSGSGSCSYCGSDYVSMLGDWLIENGSYSTDSSGVRYGINEWLTSSVKGMVYYYPSTNKIVWWAQTYSNGSPTSSLNLNMPAANGSYSWTFMVFLSSYILEMDGTITASNIHSGTSSLSYSSVYAMPSTTIPYDIKLDMSQTAASALKLIIQEIGVIAGACEENITVKDLGFINFSSHEHTWAQVGTYTESTCTSNGRVNYKCAGCGVTKTEIISAHGHIYSPQVKTQEETCSQVGIIEEKCYFCSYVKKTEIDKLEHNYNDVITTPTCLEDGYTTHTCPDCGDVLVDTYVDALGHNTTEHFTLKKQSCTETGVERYTCINDNCDYYEDETIPMDGHDYEVVSGAEGYGTQKCKGCGKVITDAIVYKIQYDLDGGSATNETTYTIETDTFTLVNPTRKGYEFTGWTGTGLTAKTMAVTISRGSLGERSYTANWMANTYTLTYDVNGGDALVNNKQSVTYDVYYSTITPTRTGYSFVKWATNDGDVYSGGKWQTDSDVTVIAEWQVNTDTKYIVRHLQQNINDDGYTVFETDNLKGESDLVITPTVNAYTGFTSPEAIKTTILPDGNRVVDYYYVRNTYSVSFVSNGGNLLDTITTKFDAPVNVNDAVRSNYTFGGWFSSEKLDIEVSLDKMPGMNMVLYAWWKEENKANEFTYSKDENVIIESYVGSKSDVTIPSYIDGKKVTEITSGAFRGDYNSIVVPETINYITSGAFNCTVKKITLPFLGCSREETIYYKVVLGYIFGHSSYGVTGMIQQIYGQYYYIPKTLEHVVVTGGEIKREAFSNCDFIKKIDLVGDFEYIGENAFYNTGIEELIIPEGVSSIKNHAFDSCDDLKGIVLPNSLTEMGAYTFMNCKSIESIVIPHGVSSVGGAAFYGCSALKSIVIPSTISNVVRGAFSSCTSLKTIYYGGDSNNWSSISIDSSNSCFTSAKRYYFSEDEPKLNSGGTAYNDNYWHYVDGVPTPWVY